MYQSNFETKIDTGKPKASLICSISQIDTLSQDQKFLKKAVTEVDVGSKDFLVPVRVLFDHEQRSKSGLKNYLVVVVLVVVVQYLLN